MQSLKIGVTSLAMACVSLAPFDAASQVSAFAKLQFGENIFIEVPRNWTYLSDQVRRHLNTGSEAVGRLAGVPVAQGDNQILIAGNAFTSYRTPSATFRLSVRPGEAPTQANVRDAGKLPKAKMAAALRPVLLETERALRTVDGVQSVKALDVRIESNSQLSCIFTEFEVSHADATMLTQTWVCPTGDRSVKLSTSYRKSEVAMLKPVILHVWSTLRIQ